MRSLIRKKEFADKIVTCMFGLVKKMRMTNITMGIILINSELYKDSDGNAKLIDPTIMRKIVPGVRMEDTIIIT